ncbi:MULTISPECIES: hypothetical protein [unclassified Microcoleus]|uniref:hypothetical protein n=1 Tax=unclassified Microcoleus TaxID=2642155 RepID=UPI0025F001F7|nr:MULTISPECIES: hypothetical protein [unclassified Microcoleus]
MANRTAITQKYYPKELVESPPAIAGEIKIRLFITPILFLPKRARTGAPPLQTVNCQLSNRLLSESCKHSSYPPSLGGTTVRY